MSATSGIGVAPGLTEAWTNALSDKGVRFVLIGIEKESLVHDKTIRGTHGSLDADIALLENEVQPDVPAYILGRIADSTWLAISYVPDIAKIRDKMLYASTRGALTKALGATYFPSSLFLTSKAELVPGAYASLLKSQSAPLPYSEREKDALAVREAERAAGASYEGARARVSPLQHSKGFKVADDVHGAIESLGAGGEGRLVILNVDVEKETIVLSSSESCSSSDLASKLPSSTPCYAFFSHPLPNVPYTVFIYSCPSTSPIKQRMLYASNTLTLSNSVKSILESSRAPLHPRRIETSEPSSLDVAFLTHELVESAEAKAFARSQSALASRSNSTAGGATGRGGGEGEVEEGGNVSSVRGAIAAMEARARDASAEMPSNTGFARPKGPGRKR